MNTQLADQIAAGEVVERPASVVKELMENAIDAGATRIALHLGQDPLSLIRVVDNGSGMSPEDAPLSLQRHATSKLRSLDDLHTLTTRGFRGEALPSIASVSRLQLTTRTPDDSLATRVEAHGAQGGSLTVAASVAGAAPGTTVQVRDLFHNVPARRKFLRSVPTEVAHITDMVQRLVLSAPHVHVSVTREGGRSRTFPPTDGLPARAQQVFKSIPLGRVSEERPTLDMEAALADATHSRSGTQRLHLMINGRPVRDRGLARCIAFAYGAELPAGHYPMGVVALAVPPSSLDVNVHPQKTEVRFADPQQLFDQVTRAIAKGRVTTKTNSTPPRPLTGTTRHPRFTGLGDGGPVRSHLPPADTGATPAGMPFGIRRFLGNVHNGRHWVVETGEGIAVIRGHAARTALRALTLYPQVQSGTVESKTLLFPCRVPCADQDVAHLERSVDTFAMVGLEVRATGPRGGRLDAVPTALMPCPQEALLRAALTWRPPQSGSENPIQHLVATLARASHDPEDNPANQDHPNEVLEGLHSALARLDSTTVPHWVGQPRLVTHRVHLHDEPQR